MMKRLLPIILFLCLAVPSRAALTSDTVWEMRQAGDDLNGGCFDTGATGTDFSQQDAAQDSGTDLATVDNDTVSSATHNFVAADVGNCINISAGTGFTAGYYQIVSVTTNNANLDRAVGTHPLTAGTWRYGGAVGGTGVATFTSSVVAGNTVHIKSGSDYTHTATIVALTVVGTVTAPITWRGYQTTRGDDTGTRPVFTSATNSIALWTLNAASFNRIHNIKFTHTAATRGICISYITADSDSTVINNALFDGCLNAVSYAGSADESILSNSTILNTTGIGVTTGTNNNNNFIGNVFYNVGAGAGTHNAISFTSATNPSGKIINNVFSTSSGNGIATTNTASTPDWIISGNVFENNTGDGVTIVDAVSAQGFLLVIANNIFWSNTGFAINFSGYGSAAEGDGTLGFFSHNAYGDNTAGNFNNLSAGASEVTITGDPFIASGAGLDWDLDNTANEGAALRAAGFTGVLGGTGNTNTVGFRDIGASQHQDAGGTTIIVPGAPVGY